MLYNYKDLHPVQDVVVDSISTVIDDIVEMHDGLMPWESISLYIPSYLAKEIVSELIFKYMGFYTTIVSNNYMLCEEDTDVVVSIYDTGGIYVKGTLSGISGSNDSHIVYIYDEYTKSIIDGWIKDNDIRRALIFGFKEASLDGEKYDYSVKDSLDGVNDVTSGYNPDDANCKDCCNKQDCEEYAKFIKENIAAETEKASPKVNKDITKDVVKEDSKNDVPADKKADVSAVSEDTVKKSFSINGKDVSEKEFNEFAKTIEEKYSENIRSMLVDYAEFMDEMNEWHKLLRW
jgi:hypothetical protein